MNSFIVGKDFLTAVINEICMDGRFDRFSVKEDFYDLRLLDVRCSDMGVERIVDRDEFNSARSQVALAVDPRHHTELPGHEDLRSSLHSSLLLPPENMDEVVGSINEAITASRRRHQFKGQMAISIDSNLAYKRLLSRLFLEKGRFGLEYDNPKDLMVPISKVSVRELSSASNHKLDKQKNPTGFKRSLPGRCFTDHLINRPTLRSVKALNALAEHGNIRDIFTYYEVDEDMPDVFDSGKADEYIVRELSSYFKKGQMDMTFLTADDSMSSLLDGERMDYLIVRYPNEVPSRLTGTPWLVRELLYDLCLNFRCIRFEGTGVSLMSVWDGKTSSDYLDERICVNLAEGSRIGEELSRDFRILKRFQDSKTIDLKRLR